MKGERGSFNSDDEQERVPRLQNCAPPLKKVKPRRKYWPQVLQNIQLSTLSLPTAKLVQAAARAWVMGICGDHHLKQVRQVAIDWIQECLACFLAFDASNFKKPVQFILRLWNLFNCMQLLWIQNVKHVIKDGLQITWVQANLAQHRVFLFCKRNFSC